MIGILPRRGWDDIAQGSRACGNPGLSPTNVTVVGGMHRFMASGATSVRICVKLSVPEVARQGGLRLLCCGLYPSHGLRFGVPMTTLASLLPALYLLFTQSADDLAA